MSKLAWLCLFVYSTSAEKASVLCSLKQLSVLVLWSAPGSLASCHLIICGKCVCGWGGGGGGGGAIFQVLVYDILPTTIASIDYALGFQKTNCQLTEFFVGAQLAVSL